MLDWPEASQTSPTSTSFSVAVFPFWEAVSVCPAALGYMGGRVTVQLPLESAFVFSVAPPKVTDIS
ncbi:MAG: hypothetical protein ACLS9G_03250, partial [Akkermansia sp.]